jgi:hypothetical protein
MPYAVRFAFTRRRTDGAGGFLGIEWISKWTTRIVVGGVVVMATVIYRLRRQGRKRCLRSFRKACKLGQLSAPKKSERTLILLVKLLAVTPKVAGSSPVAPAIKSRI